MAHLCYLCLVLAMLSRLYIAALWSPEGKGLTSWLLFVMFIVICYFAIWYPGTGVVLDLSVPDPCCLSYLVVISKSLESTVYQ